MCTLATTCMTLGRSECTQWYPPPYDANYMFSNNGSLTYPLGWSMKQPHFHDTLFNKDLAPGIDWQPCGRHHRVYLIEEPIATQRRQKSHLLISKRLFLLENSFHLLGKKLFYLHLKDSLLNMNMNCTWSNHWQHPNTRSLLLIAPRIIDLPLKLDGGQLSLTLSLEIISYATFALIIMRHTLCPSVLCRTPLVTVQCEGVSSLSFNRIIGLILASTSQRLPHAVALGTPSWCTSNQFHFLKFGDWLCNKSCDFPPKVTLVLHHSSEAIETMKYFTNNVRS